MQHGRGYGNAPVGIGGDPGDPAGPDVVFDTV